MVRLSPGSPSQCSATLSPWPASTCRSTQLARDVELAADEPLGEGRLPVEDLAPLRRPVEPLGLLLPEREPVLRGLVVEVGLGDGVLREVVARREGALLVQEVREGFAAHGCSSLVVRTVDGSLSTPLRGVARSGCPGSSPAAATRHPLEAVDQCTEAFSMPDAGQRPDLELGRLVLVVLLAEHGAQPAEEEAQRDRHEARVVQREPVEVDARVGHQGRALGAWRDGGLPDTTGEKMTSPTAEIRPP